MSEIDNDKLELIQRRITDDVRAGVEAELKKKYSWLGVIVAALMGGGGVFIVNVAVKDYVSDTLQTVRMAGEQLEDSRLNAAKAALDTEMAAARIKAMFAKIEASEDQVKAQTTELKEQGVAISEQSVKIEELVNWLEDVSEENEIKISKLVERVKTQLEIDTQLEADVADLKQIGELTLSLSQRVTNLGCCQNVEGNSSSGSMVMAGLSVNDSIEKGQMALASLTDSKGVIQGLIGQGSQSLLGTWKITNWRQGSTRYWGILDVERCSDQYSCEGMLTVRPSSRSSKTRQKMTIRVSGNQVNMIGEVLNDDNWHADNFDLVLDDNKLIGKNLDADGNGSAIELTRQL